MSNIFLTTAKSIVEHLDSPNSDILAQAIEQAIREHKTHIQTAATETVAEAMQNVWEETAVSVEAFPKGLTVRLAYDVDAPEMLTRMIDLAPLLDDMARSTEPSSEAICAVDMAIDALKAIRAKWAQQQ